MTRNSIGIRARQWCGRIRFPFRILMAVMALALAFGPSSGRAESPPSFALQWGGTGSAEGQFQLNWGLATGPLDNVYVVDTGNQRVQKFDGDGHFIRMWGWGVATGAAQFEICTSGCHAGIPGDGAGQFNQPRGVVVSATGQLFVADEQNHRVNEFDMDGNFIGAWGWGTATGLPQFEICTANCRAGLPGPGQGQFTYPHAVAIDPADNSLFVVDSVNNRLQKFTYDGVYLTMWGWGLNGVWFENPSGAAVDSHGNVYVVEPNMNRVQKLDSAGNLLASWATAGSGEGEFNEPHGVAVDSFDNFYIAERYNYRVQKFDPEGNFLTMWGTEGVEPGQFIICTEIAVNSLDNVYVGDSTDRVQRFDVSAAAVTDSLLGEVENLDLEPGIEQNLSGSVKTALDILTDSTERNDFAAVWNLNAFINKVEALRGKKLSEEEADALVAWARTAIEKILAS